MVEKADLALANGHAGAEDRTQVARAGMFFLATDCEPDADVTEIVRRVGDALGADNRVIDLTMPEIRVDWITRYEMHPDLRRTSEQGVLTGADHFHTLVMSGPIQFTVRVPKKNQPAFRGYTDFPSDTYHVAWDGATAIVLWEQIADDPIPMAGGHIVVDILADAAKAAGQSLYVQACSPNCKNQFIHNHLRVTANRVVAELSLAVQTDPEYLGPIDMHVPTLSPPSEAALSLHYAADIPTLQFSILKNGARRLRDLEAVTRGLLVQLLVLNRSRAVSQAIPIWRLRRYRALWQSRKSRREAARVIAEVWLGLAALENLRRTWDEDRLQFHHAQGTSVVGPLYGRDYADDEAAVLSMNMTLVRSAVESTAARLDNRSVTLATTTGAAAVIVGAVIGGAVS
jgi:hypothetical protein